MTSDRALPLDHLDHLEHGARRDGDRWVTVLRSALERYHRVSVTAGRVSHR